jgi:ribose 5-phosphate isomerase B
VRLWIGTDEDRPVVSRMAAQLRERGHDVTIVPVKPWAEMAIEVGRAVAEGRADQGIVCCWTGTGVCMAANKVDKVRAALCVDAATAAGARKWNDANVLALSLRLLSEPLADEILEAWLATSYAGSEDASLQAMDGLAALTAERSRA